MNFIKNVFDKKIGEAEHLQFQKFSKGEFRDRALIEIKKAGNGKYTIKTSAEFGNELVKICAKELGEKSAKVTGAIVSTLDLDVKYKEKKQFQGVKRYIIDDEMTGNSILKLVEENPKVFFGLSFKGDDFELKIKPKAPKSGKPGKGDEEPKADFCSLKTTNAEIAKEFIFEASDFKQAKVKHVFLIERMVMPEGENDYAKIRELAKRKGKIIRKADIDGVAKTTEIEFEA